jgi:Fe-coproporphyrin III synthase
MSKFGGLALTALKSNVTTLSRPYKLNYAITMGCQSRCLTCNIWEIKPKDELRIDEIAQFAKKNNYFRWIELTGGEPFLRSDIVQIAKTFTDNAKSLYILTMPTNSLCNQETELSRLREILELGVPRVAVTLSLDGHRELHDKIRGIPGNYDKVISMHKRLTELKKEYKNLYFLFGYTMSKFNEGQFRATYEAVKKEIPNLRYNDFHVNLSQTSSNYYHNQQSEIKTDNSAAILEIADIIKNRRFDADPIQVIQNAFMKGLLKFASTGKTPIKCRSLEASIFMDSWGNVYPSIMWDRKIANIRDIGYDLDGVWESEEAKEVKRLIAEGKDPQQWTSCEAYQSITGRISSLII